MYEKEACTKHYGKDSSNTRRRCISSVREHCIDTAGSGGLIPPCTKKKAYRAVNTDCWQKGCLRTPFYFASRKPKYFDLWLIALEYLRETLHPLSVLFAHPPLVTMCIVWSPVLSLEKSVHGEQVHSQTFPLIS